MSSSVRATASRTAFARLRRHQTARWALAVIAVLVVAAIVGPMLMSGTGNELLGMADMKNRPPSWAHPFGTDPYSRDLLSRVLRGARISLAIGTLAAALSMSIGTAYGMVSGYFGGRLDAVLSRLLDAFLSIPRVLILLATLVLWSPVPLWGLILLLGGTGWFGVSRIVRAETLIVRQQPYIEAARALGASHWAILARHILPNVIASVLVAATLGVGNVIALEAGLSYLGIGAHEPTPSWGSIFLDGVDFYAGNWWVVLFPGMAIVITVLAFNVLGDALRDVLDPRQLPATTRQALNSHVEKE